MCLCWEDKEKTLVKRTTGRERNGCKHIIVYIGKGGWSVASFAISCVNISSYISIVAKFG